MLNYTDPTYDVVKTSPHSWVINVEVKLSESEINEEDRIKILTEEADKSSLFSMAFIQKLAHDGDTHAKDIQSLYQAYKKYLETGDSLGMHHVCMEVLKNDSPYFFPKDCARYLLALISRQPTDLVCERSEDLFRRLVPYVEKIGKVGSWQKIDEEQEISVSEGEEAAHKAFPDLIKYKNVYYIAYREAKAHVDFKDLGAIRLLKGYYAPEEKVWSWENMQLLVDSTYDLRDPRFFINGENNLQLVVGGSCINEEKETTIMVPHIATLDNGQWRLNKAVVDPSANGANGQWMWRVTWNLFDNYGYAFSYGKEAFSLVRTSDGETFEKVVDVACESLTDLSEATLRFKIDGTAIALIRARRNGIIGVAHPVDGYRTWQFQVIPFRVGGPNFVFAHDEQRMWAATRHFFLHQNNELDEATILASMTQQTLTPLARLKSSYDSGYPGIVLEEDGSLIVVYYSSVLDGASSLYITRIRPVD